MTRATIKESCRQATIRRTIAYPYLAEGCLERTRLGAKTLITQRSLDALIKDVIATGSNDTVRRVCRNQPARGSLATPFRQGDL